MAREMTDWKFNKIRLVNWSNFGFAEMNGLNEQEKFRSSCWVKGQPFDLGKGQHV